MLGIAPRGDFEEFSKQVIEYGRMANIRSLGSVVAAIITIAQREIRLAEEDGVVPDSSWVRTAELVGPSVPPDAAKVIRQAVAKVIADGDLDPEQPWRALEMLAADYLGAE